MVAKYQQSCNEKLQVDILATAQIPAHVHSNEA